MKTARPKPKVARPANLLRLSKWVAFRFRFTPTPISFPTATRIRALFFTKPLPDGKAQDLHQYQSDIYTVAYYAGTKRVRRKFSDLAKARREAETHYLASIALPALSFFRARTLELISGARWIPA